VIEQSPSFDELASQPPSGLTADSEAPQQSSEIVPPSVSHQTANPDESAPPDGDPDASPQVLSSVARELGSVRNLLETHSWRLEELVRLGERREEMIDRLHEENQRLRAGEITHAQAPVIRELIRTYDLVLQLIGGSDTEDLSLVRRRLLDAFEQVGLRAFEPADGEAFDHNHHQAVNAVLTAVEEENMTVVMTSRPGFVRVGGEVVRPAEVQVRKYKPQASDQVNESDDGAEPGRDR